MKEAERLLSRRNNTATLQRERLSTQLFRTIGKEAVMNLKKAHYNLKLEDFVVGAAHSHMTDVVNAHLVPRMSIIFLTPQSRCGRAPFYSSQKRLGDLHIKTLWFNTAVLLLMCVIVSLMLFTDCPGRFVRKDNES